MDPDAADRAAQRGRFEQQQDQDIQDQMDRLKAEYEHVGQDRQRAMQDIGKVAQFDPHTHEGGPTEGLYQTRKPDEDDDQPVGEGPITGTDYPITQQSTGKPANRQQRRAAERRQAKAEARAIERGRPQVVDGQVIGEDKLGLEKPNDEGKTIDDIFSEAEDITQLLWMLVGAGSMAWEDVRQAGLFDEAYANKIAAVAEGRLIEIVQELIKAGVMEALSRIAAQAREAGPND